MEDHVLMYLDEGMVELTENNHTTRLTSGDCAFIRKDCNVMMNKKCIDGKPFMATFLTFKRSFLQETFRSFDKATLPSNARRSNNSVIKLPNNRPDIKSLFDSLKPYYESNITPSDELLKLNMTEGLYVLLNTDKNLYASLFDFKEPWKIDILEFMNRNFRYDLSIKQIANYTDAASPPSNATSRNSAPSPPNGGLCNAGSKRRASCLSTAPKRFLTFVSP